MFLAARDAVAVPADPTAAWVSDVGIQLKISVFLLSLVAYDASASLIFQVSRITLITISVITIDEEVLYPIFVAGRFAAL